MKSLRRIILAGIALILLLGAGAYVAVKITLPPGKIRELIRAKGTEALGRPVAVDDIHIRLFPQLKINVREVNVANAPGFSAEPVIKLRQLDLSISFLSLLRFAPEIQEVKLVSPEILYEVDAYGRNNLEGLGKPDTAAAPEPSKPLEIPAAVALKSFVILDGRVRYRDAQSGRELTLGRINQKVSLTLDPRLQDVVSEGRLEVAEISVRDSASGLRKGQVRVFVHHDIRLDLPGERLHIKKLELAFQDIKAQVTGSVSNFGSVPEADLRIEAPEISLASVLKEVPPSLSPEIPKLKASGQASFQAHIQGKLDSASLPDIEAVAKLENGALSHADVPQGIQKLELDAVLRHDSLRAKISFGMGPSPVLVEVLASELREVPQLEKLFVEAALDLENLAALALRMGLLEKGTKASGTKYVRLNASGPLDPANPQNLKASGYVQLNSVALELPGKPPIRLDGRADITNEKIKERLTAKVGQSDVSLDAEVHNYLPLALPKLAKGGRTRVKAEVRSGFLDLDALMPPSSSDKPGPEAPPMKAYPPLPPVDADVSVNLARTRFMGLEMTGFQLNTQARAAEILTRVKGSVYSGSFSSTARLQPKSPTDMGVAFKLNAARVEANDFISRLNDRVPTKHRLLKSLAAADSLLFGKLNLDMDLATHGLPHQFVDNLTGTVLLALADGKLLPSGLTQGFSGALAGVSSSLGFRDLTFGGLKGDLRVENGGLQVRDFRLDGTPVGALMAAGRIAFDNSLDLKLTQTLPPAASKLLTGPGNALSSQLSKFAPGAKASLVPTDAAGRALLYFTAGGTLSRPSFALDAKRMAQEGVGGSAKAALTEELDKRKAELKAKADAEREKLEAEARSKVEAEKKKLEEKAEAEKQKAAEEAKKQGKKVLKGLGL